MDAGQRIDRLERRLVVTILGFAAIIAAAG
jgi:hypothetical protein